METILPPAAPMEKPWKISGRIAPAKIGPLYKLGTTLTALFMVLLPLVYVGLIAGVVWAIYAHAVYDTELLESSRGNGRGNFFAYIVPLVGGVFVVIFMVKPLFARRAKRPPQMEITRQQQPQLFAFIDQICGLVRAPKPRRVVVDLQVNASASFTRGMWSLTQNDLTLTIGLPLVTGLSTRELGGVFAHEFGHFAQGAGMRMTYIIRSLNAWFARLVYERDSWDKFLRDASSKIDIRIGIVFYVARLAVWLTRKVLWAFMMAGHGISCFMLRQMEFDADHYETQVAGSEAFKRTCQALPVIGAGWQRAVSRQQESFAAKRLVNDLATYTALETQRVSAETKQAIVKSVKGAKTGWFDTHPTDFDRMKAAHHANAAGVLSGEGSATELFADFPALAQQATAAYYQHECEIDLAKVQLLPLEEVAGEAEALAATDQAMKDFYRNVLTRRTLLYVSPGELRRPPPSDLLPHLSREAIARYEKATQEITKPIEALLEADGKDIAAVQAQALLGAGFKLKAGTLGLKKATITEADAAVAEARFQVAQHRGTLSEALAATRDRLVKGLQFYFREPLPEGLKAAEAEEIERLSRILGAMEQATSAVTALRNDCSAFGLLLHNNPEEATQTFVNAVRQTGRRIQGYIQEVTRAMDRLEYPFGHARGTVLLADFLAECEGHPDESVFAFLQGQALLDRLFTLYQRVMGRLAQLALRAEQATVVKS
jgi:Zn-dependent protease with chaperone function